MNKPEPKLVYILMEEMDPIAVYHTKLDAQNAAIEYSLRNYTILARELA